MRGVLLLALASLVSSDLCGNGLVEPPEACDDGNARSGDGCSRVCLLEDGFLCTPLLVSGGGLTTQCCPARRNPVTGAEVCSCAGQESGSAAYTVAADCSLRDVDECRLAHGGCAPNGLCVNLDGRDGGPGFTCHCPEGLHGDGRRCDGVLYAAVMTLGVGNVTDAGNYLSPAWIEERVASLLAGREVLEVEAVYLARGRRLLATAFDHVVLSLEVADWDVMLALVEDVNAELVAEFLRGEAEGLNQIAVLQETTTLVREAPQEFSASPVESPGFLLTNVSYEPLPGAGWDALGHLWRLVAHFHAPEGLTHVLFATDGHGGASPTEHACARATDVCCLHRMNSDHHLGAFGEWVAANLSPLCTEEGGFPDEATALQSSADVLGSLPSLSWVAGLFDSFSRSNLSEPAPGMLQLDLAQEDVIQHLAAEELFEDGDRYSFAVGMLFLRPLPVPELYCVIGQTRVEIFVSETVNFVAASQQQYSFLEFLDAALHEIEYRPTLSELSRLQFARVTFVLPEEITSGRVPSEAVQFAVASEAAAISTWFSPCGNASEVPWDLLAAAAAQDCAPQPTAFCTPSVPEGGYVFSLDVPLGDGVLPASGASLFLRFIIEGEQGVEGSSYEVLTQADLQLLAEQGTILRFCEDALLSEMRETDYVSVSVAVGVELQRTEGDPRDRVVFSDVTQTADYSAARAFDIAAQFTAVSVIESIITVAAQGEPSFFELPEHAAYTIHFHHVLTVHLRSESKYDSLAALVAAEQAYSTFTNTAGFFQMTLSEAARAVCYGPSLVPDPLPDANLDCAVLHPVADGVVRSDLAHVVSGEESVDIAWLVGLFGDNELIFRTARTFAAQTLDTFSLDFRYRQALWVVPTFPWPGGGAVGTVDRTIVLVAFAVDT